MGVLQILQARGVLPDVVAGTKNDALSLRVEHAFASGIRVGTPAATTRGLGKGEMRQVAAWIVKVISNIGSLEVRRQVKEEVTEMCRRFPIPGIE